MVEAIADAARDLLDRYRARGLRLATAESCTGGRVAGALTDLAGASEVFDCGFVTYSNQAKKSLLGVPEALIATHGAVSEPVATAMAAGALQRSTASIAVATTGVAGPAGGSAEKPVGLVHIAAARRDDGRVRHQMNEFSGDRAEIRDAAVLAALQMAIDLADE